MAVSYATYERVALEDDRVWELVCGHLREKPGMTQAHNDRTLELVAQLLAQLDRRRYRIRTNSAALRVASGTYFVPDVAVIPSGMPTAGPRSSILETYESAVPFVAEVWSPSTGEYDVDTKLAEYQARGDLEIWRIHPIEQHVTIWRRTADESYLRSSHSTGVVSIESLPNITIDLDMLFESLAP